MNIPEFIPNEQNAKHLETCIRIINAPDFKPMPWPDELWAPFYFLGIPKHGVPLQLITPLAQAFARHLKKAINAYEFGVMLLLNQDEPNSGICHSHDFCDANMVMLDAWNECFPHEEFSAQNTRHADLWNAAWSMAKQRQFSV